MAKASKTTDESKFIREMAELLGETNLSEIEVEREGLRVRVARQLSAAPAVSVPVAAAPVAPAAAASADSTPQEAAPVNHASHPGAVKSPMVGTVYTAPEPGSAAFVSVGDKVKEGQTILIVEAMKVMNPISAPKGGTVKEILISDAEPIEFDQPLMIIE